MPFWQRATIFIGTLAAICAILGVTVTGLTCHFWGMACDVSAFAPNTKSVIIPNQKDFQRYLASHRTDHNSTLTFKQRSGFLGFGHRVDVVAVANGDEQIVDSKPLEWGTFFTGGSNDDRYLAGAIVSSTTATPSVSLLVYGRANAFVVREFKLICSQNTLDLFNAMELRNLVFDANKHELRFDIESSCSQFQIGDSVIITNASDLHAQSYQESVIVELSDDTQFVKAYTVSSLRQSLDYAQQKEEFSRNLENCIREAPATFHVMHPDLNHGFTSCWSWKEPAVEVVSRTISGLSEIYVQDVRRSSSSTIIDPGSPSGTRATVQCKPREDKDTITRPDPNGLWLLFGCHSYKQMQGAYGKTIDYQQELDLGLVTVKAQGIVKHTVICACDLITFVDYILDLEHRLGGLKVDTGADRLLIDGIVYNVPKRPSGKAGLRTLVEFKYDENWNVTAVTVSPWGGSTDSKHFGTFAEH